MLNLKSINSAKTALFVTLPFLFSANVFAATSNSATVGLIFKGNVVSTNCVKSEISNQESFDTSNNKCSGALELTSVNTTTDKAANLIAFNI